MKPNWIKLNGNSCGPNSVGLVFLASSFLSSNAALKINRYVCIYVCVYYIYYPPYPPSAIFFSWLHTKLPWRRNGVQKVSDVCRATWQFTTAMRHKGCLLHLAAVLTHQCEMQSPAGLVKPVGSPLRLEYIDSGLGLKNVPFQQVYK